MLNIYLYPSSAIQKEKRYLAYILRELLFVARRNLLGRSVYEHMGLQLIMTPPDKIDTTSLLTILGVIAAVWALITPNARLRLRFCLAWWDWAIIVTSFILSNYLVLMNPLMILVKIIKLRWIHILSYDQMVSRKINNQTTRCANSIF
ncbi:hypothetical protein MXT40_28195, partial [Klebsiella pneumoniae]|nr:hypothetical protein [Klebsiella pneumoniae]